MERPSTKESIERQKPTRLVTAKGSVYTYLPDGRTQRYKAATETLEAPQDLLVFMPPWNTIETKAKELYPEVFEGVENETQFEQLLLEYMAKDGTKTIRPAVDGQEIYSLVDTDLEDQVFLNFIDKVRKRVDFVLPTSREPKVDYSTFDARKYVDEETGETMRERHIGNKVVNIEYE
jgi:hypothetical protein